MEFLSVQNLIVRCLDRNERVGNKLPDPVTLFAGLSVFILLISWLAYQLSVSATIRLMDGSLRS